jgi:hypothetical protein
MPFRQVIDEPTAKFTHLLADEPSRSRRLPVRAAWA